VLGVYERQLEPEKHEVGKQNTQRIERKDLTLRTRIKRLARETTCFSRSIVMHDIVIGLFINQYELGISINYSFQSLLTSTGKLKGYDKLTTFS
jgi:insertion element IS1 protein InsB